MISPPSHASASAARPLVGAGVSAALAMLCTWLWWVRYGRHADCIDALANSSCRTAAGDNLTAAGMLWAVPAAGFGVWALACLALAWWRWWVLGGARRRQPGANA